MMDRLRKRRDYFMLRGERFPFNALRDGWSLARLDPDTDQVQHWLLRCGKTAEVKRGDVQLISAQLDIALPGPKQNSPLRDEVIMKALEDIEALKTAQSETLKAIEGMRQQAAQEIAAARDASAREINEAKEAFVAEAERTRAAMKIRTYAVKTKDGEALTFSDLDGVQLFRALSAAMNYEDAILQLADGQTKRVLRADLLAIAAQMGPPLPEPAHV